MGRPGTPSWALGGICPCQWMMVSSARSLVRSTRKRWPGSRISPCRPEPFASPMTVAAQPSTSITRVVAVRDSGCSPAAARRGHVVVAAMAADAARKPRRVSVISKSIRPRRAALGLEPPCGSAQEAIRWIWEGGRPGRSACPAGQARTGTRERSWRILSAMCRQAAAPGLSDRHKRSRRLPTSHASLGRIAPRCRDARPIPPGDAGTHLTSRAPLLPWRREGALQEKRRPSSTA